MKDYEFELLYHPRKANVVVNALSRKTTHVSAMMIRELSLIESFRDLRLQIELEPSGIKCWSLKLTSDLLEQIKEKQSTDVELQKIRG